MCNTCPWGERQALGITSALMQDGLLACPWDGVQPPWEGAEARERIASTGTACGTWPVAPMVAAHLDTSQAFSGESGVHGPFISPGSLFLQRAGRYVRKADPGWTTSRRARRCSPSLGSRAALWKNNAAPCPSTHPEHSEVDKANPVGFVDRRAAQQDREPHTGWLWEHTCAPGGVRAHACCVCTLGRGCAVCVHTGVLRVCVGVSALLCAHACACVQVCAWVCGLCQEAAKRTSYYGITGTWNPVTGTL